MLDCILGVCVCACVCVCVCVCVSVSVCVSVCVQGEEAGVEWGGQGNRGKW